MIESVFIILLAIAFLLFLLGIERKSIIYSGISLILWILIMIQSLYIQVPGDTDYSEMGLNAFALIFIMVNIIHIIYLYMVPKNKGGLVLP